MSDLKQLNFQSDLLDYTPSRVRGTGIHFPVPSQNTLRLGNDFHVVKVHGHVPKVSTGRGVEILIEFIPIAAGCLLVHFLTDQ